MTRVVAAAFALGITLLLIALVPVLWSAAMSFFEALSAQQQLALRIGLAVLSGVMLCLGGWWRSRARPVA